LAPYGEIERWLHREQHLLDERAWWQWLDLFDANGRYWVTNGSRDPTDVRQGVIIYEDKTALTARIRRLLHPAAYTQEPPPRTQHFLTNVWVEPCDAAADEWQATGSLCVVAARLDALSAFVGRVEYRLCGGSTGWRLVEKRVTLIHNDQPLTLLPLL
jgi:benzoate/toluate 1,2-dioxygenase beta subunit